LDTRVYDEYRKRDTLISNDKANEYINKLYSVDHKWDEMFDALIEYKEKYGDCDVPQRHVSVSGQRLGNWVNTQRRFRKTKKLSPERVERLNEVGFVWASYRK